MRKVLTMLIEDDIKITRLVRSLDHLDIDASSHLMNTSSVIFELIKIENLQQNELLMDAYFKKIDQAIKDEIENDEKHIDSIIDWLKLIAKEDIN